MNDPDLTILPVLSPNDILTKINTSIKLGSKDTCTIDTDDLIEVGREIWCLRQQYKSAMKRLSNAR